MTLTPSLHSAHCRQSERVWTTCLGVAVAAIGFVLNYYYGDRDINRVFYHEFEMAWRLYVGQIPFVDFVTIQGLTPAVLQIPFFYLFGANYESLVIHSSVANAVASVTVFWVLRLLCVSQLAAVACSILTAIVFYTPHGVPMPPQHSWLFALLIIALQIKLLSVRSLSLIIGGYVLIGIFAFLGYMSKPAPLGFFAPLSLFLIVLSQPRVWAWSLVSGLGGLMAAVFLFVIVTGSEDGPSLTTLWYYIIELPLNIGTNRSTGTSIIYSIVKIFGSSYRFNLATIILLFGASLAVLFLLIKTKFQDHRRIEIVKVVIPAVIGVWILTITIVFQGLSHHHYYLGLPLIFLSLGCLYSVLSVLGPEEVTKVKPKVSGKSDFFGSTYQVVIASLFGVVALSDSLVFHMLGNVQRGWVHDYRITEVVPMEAEFPGMEYVKFYGKILKTGYSTIEMTSEKVAATLRKEKIVYDYVVSIPENVLLLDFQYVTFPAVRKVNILPAMNFVPGFSSPPKNHEMFSTMVESLRRNIRKFGLVEVVLSNRYYQKNLGLFKKYKDVICNIDHRPLFTALKICPANPELLPTFLLRLVGAYGAIEGSYFKSTAENY